MRQEVARGGVATQIVGVELIDIGANLTHNSFESDRDAVIARAIDAGVVGMVLTGTSGPDNPRVAALAESRPDYFRSTSGVHPHEAASWSDEIEASLRELAKCATHAAIGECGLDYNRNYSPRDLQREAFEAQLRIAAELGKPVFMHERDAHEDFARIVEKWRAKLPAAVIHCFTGSDDALKRYLELDLHVGITGWICDERRGAHLHESVAKIPADRLMIETDAPYLLPRTIRPKPKGRRNEPMHLPWVLRTLAEARGETPETLAHSTTATARAFFWPG